MRETEGILNLSVGALILEPRKSIVGRFIITGGQPLQGTIPISGSKNAVLPIFAATLLADGPCRIENVPRLRDVKTMLRVLDTLGCRPSEFVDGVVTLDPTGVNRFEAPYDLVKTMRASFVVLGPLVARHGRARVSMPGGCAIGVRQVDLHIKGLQALGVQVEVSEGYVDARADSLKGATIVLDFPSVGATQNVMMAATLAKGTTILENAAKEPEIDDLARFLEGMGARLQGAGTSVIRIEGVDRLGGVTHRVIPDRIETGTYALAAAITGGELVLKDAATDYLDAVLSKLRESGAHVRVDGRDLVVRGGETRKAISITTQPYPGFPTDLQAPMSAYMAIARGTSTVNEQIFENRFGHMAELNRMGARIQIQSQSGALIRGVDHLSSAPVMASDLRAGAALVLAGLAARGRTEVSRVYHIDRGYESIEAKLTAVGASIERISR